jgi:hypothetical protein
MSHVKIGRNDPCHCGSGKKYKRCHLPADEQRARAEAVTRPARTDDVDRPNVDVLRGDVERLAKRAPAKDRAKWTRAIAGLEVVVAYQEQREQIEAACQALEAHRAEFEALAQDEEAYADRARKLFAEEAFMPVRFRAADVQRAFDAVGVPTATSPAEETVKTLREAILFLAGKTERSTLAMRLLMLLPEYVHAGRHLDAWVIQHCALMTSEELDESNAFLIEMFMYGVTEWEEHGQAVAAEVVRDFGLDIEQLRGMGPAEAFDLIRQLAANPQTARKMEALLEAHPEMRATAEANLRDMEADCAELLRREDAWPLLLSPEEVKPWLGVFQERFLASQDKFAALSTGGKPGPSVEKAVSDWMYSLTTEMARAIFTKPRREQLQDQLRQYARERSAAGEKAAAHQAQSALVMLRSDCDPADIFFLLAICHVSLTASLRAMMGSR